MEDEGGESWIGLILLTDARYDDDSSSTGDPVSYSWHTLFVFFSCFVWCIATFVGQIWRKWYELNNRILGSFSGVRLLRLLTAYALKNELGELASDGVEQNLRGK